MIPIIGTPQQGTPNFGTSPYIAKNEVVSSSFRVFFCFLTGVDLKIFVVLSRMPI